MTNQILPRALDVLTVHPLLAQVPRLALDAPEMLALIASIETHGVFAPLLINERREIIDGRARLIAAEKAGLTEVPCSLVADEDAASIKLRYHFQRTWTSLDADRRQALAPQVRDTVAEMPPEIREMFAREIRAADKARKEAGQSF